MKAFEGYMDYAEWAEDKEAQYKVANCYYYGKGVVEDKKEAFKWYMEAAKQGLANAQYKVGNCYYSGEGVKKDEEEAFLWYTKAAKQGNEMAIEILENDF